MSHVTQDSIGLSSRGRQPLTQDGEPPLLNAAARLLIIVFVVYVTIEAFEAPIRYFLAMRGLDFLIFSRDILMVLSLLILLILQIFRNEVQSAFIIYAMIIIIHGTIGYLLTGSAVVPIYGAKVLIGILFGACLAPMFAPPQRRIVIFLLIIWITLVAGLALERMGVTFPWRGFNTTIGGVSVDIQRGWGSEGIERVGGFTRGSILAAVQISVTAIFLLAFLRSIALRIVIAVVTLIALFLTTQKGAIGSYAVVLLCICFASRRSLLLSKIALAGFALLVVLAPVTLEWNHVPSGHGIFSLESLRDRIELVWPDAWRLIGDNSWLFGTGLGGIGGGQRFLLHATYNPADNLFVIAYGYFGVFCLIYFAVPLLRAMRVPDPPNPATRFALLTLTFLVGYGVVVNLLEGPISTVFLGISVRLLLYSGASVGAPNPITELPIAVRTPTIAAGNTSVS